MKTAGRDAGKPAVIIEVIDHHTVLIDGAARRRKVNINHIQLLGTKVEIKKGATPGAVVKALETAGFEIQEKQQTYEKRTKTKKSKKK